MDAMAFTCSTITESFGLVAKLTESEVRAVTKLIVHVKHRPNMLSYHTVRGEVSIRNDIAFVNAFRVFTNAVVITKAQTFTLKFCLKLRINCTEFKTFEI